MSAWTKFMTFLVMSFWPWFKKYVWPLIREKVMAIVRLIIEKFGKDIEDWLKKRNKEREKAARQKADEADNKAEQDFQ